MFETECQKEPQPELVLSEDEDIDSVRGHAEYIINLYRSATSDSDSSGNVESDDDEEEEEPLTPTTKVGRRLGRTTTRERSIRKSLSSTPTREKKIKKQSSIGDLSSPPSVIEMNHQFAVADSSVTTIHSLISRGERGRKSVRERTSLRKSVSFASLTQLRQRNQLRELLDSSSPPSSTATEGDLQESRSLITSRSSSSSSSSRCRLLCKHRSSSCSKLSSSSERSSADMNGGGRSSACSDGGGNTSSSLRSHLKKSSSERNSGRLGVSADDGNQSLCSFLNRRRSISSSRKRSSSKRHGGSSSRMARRLSTGSRSMVGGGSSSTEPRRKNDNDGHGESTTMDTTTVLEHTQKSGHPTEEDENRGSSPGSSSRSCSSCSCHGEAVVVSKNNDPQQRGPERGTTTKRLSWSNDYAGGGSCFDDLLPGSSGPPAMEKEERKTARTAATKNTSLLKSTMNHQQPQPQATVGMAMFLTLNEDMKTTSKKKYRRWKSVCGTADTRKPDKVATKEESESEPLRLPMLYGDRVAMGKVDARNIVEKLKAAKLAKKKSRLARKRRASTSDAPTSTKTSVVGGDGEMTSITGSSMEEQKQNLGKGMAGIPSQGKRNSLQRTLSDVSLTIQRLMSTEAAGGHELMSDMSASDCIHSHRSNISLRHIKQKQREPKKQISTRSDSENVMDDDEVQQKRRRPHRTWSWSSQLNDKHAATAQGKSLLHQVSSSSSSRDSPEELQTTSSNHPRAVRRLSSSLLGTLQMTQMLDHSSKSNGFSTEDDTPHVARTN